MDTEIYLQRPRGLFHPFFDWAQPVLNTCAWVCARACMCLCSLFCSSCERGVLLIQPSLPTPPLRSTSKLVPLFTLPCPIFECRAAQVEQEVAPVSEDHRGGVSVIRKTRGWKEWDKKPLEEPEAVLELEISSVIQTSLHSQEFQLAPFNLYSLRVLIF